MHHLQPASASAVSGSSSSSSSSASVSPSLRSAKTFSTSSTDFALPFGGKLISTGDALPPSGPISIPSSPSLASTVVRPSAISISPSKFSPRHASFHAGDTGLGLGNMLSPSARDHSSGPLQHPQSPTLHMSGDSWLGMPLSSAHPTSPGPSTLLRRGPGMTSPGFAVASPARFRRASMLGREVTPFQLDQEGSDDDQSTKQYKGIGQTEADDGDDEMMQVDEESASASRAPSTPAMGPPAPLVSMPGTPPNGALSASAMRRQATSALRMATSDSGQDSSSSAGEKSGQSSAVRSAKSPSIAQQSTVPVGGRSRSSSLLSGNAIRKPGAKRGSALPRDRSVLRVAASLQDEDRPEDSEIASEAKLQKRLGSSATVPRTPRLGGDRQSSSSRMSKSPFLGSVSGGKQKHMWDDQYDDIQGVFVADGLDDADSSDLSSEGEEMAMYYSRTSSFSGEEDQHRDVRATTDDNMNEDPVSRPSDLGNYTDLDGVSEAEPGENGAKFAPASLGSTSASSSLPKRKSSLWMGFRDKGNVHKWSPGSGSTGPLSERAILRRSGGGGATTMDVETSPRIAAAYGAGFNARLSKRKMGAEERYGPYKRRAVSPMNLGAPASSANSAGGITAPVAGQGHNNGANSPSFLPVASPSSSFAAAGGILYRGSSTASSSAAAVAAAAAAHHHHHYARYSTSPTISRPCTPTHNHPTPTFTANGGSSFSPAAAAGSGSGPGYGSGALGLSISANHTTSPTLQALEQEENEAMDQRVGMLGLS